VCAKHYQHTHAQIMRAAGMSQPLIVGTNTGMRWLPAAGLERAGWGRACLATCNGLLHMAAGDKTHATHMVWPQCQHTPCTCRLLPPARQRWPLQGTG
jgi:hypothetical protein